MGKCPLIGKCPLYRQWKQENYYVLWKTCEEYGDLCGYYQDCKDSKNVEECILKVYRYLYGFP